MTRAATAFLSATLLLTAPLVACSDATPKLNQEGIEGPGVEIDADAIGSGDPTGAQCTAWDSCEDGDPCTENRCVDGECAAIPIEGGTCCETDVVFAEAFDGSEMALQLSAINDKAGWHVLDARATSPPAALYFGDPASFDYDAGERVAGTATLPVISLPAGRIPRLTLRLYSDVEPKLTYDMFWIEADILGDGGEVVETRQILTKATVPPTAYDEFALVSIPLDGFEGKSVQMRLQFDSVDGNNNHFEGIWIDDIAIEATCPILAECEEDAQCDDGDECTLDACSPEGCVYETIDECGAEPLGGPCDGADAPEDCCVTDADCDDGNPATVNVCEGATCVTSINPDVCTADADCDDTEVCTTDACVEGVCEYTGAVVEGCCVEQDLSIADFDKGKLSGIYVTDNLETGIFWNVDKTRSTTGDYSLYCGDPVPQTYSIGARVKSSATTPVLEIPKGGQTTVTFDLYKATRGHRDYDVFQVFVLRKGALFPIWSSKALDDGETQGDWRLVELPLNTYAGQDIQLRFVFDSVDAPGAAFEGVYFDSVRVQTVCK